MWSHIINIHLNELLHTKTKKSKINEHKKILKNKQFTYFYLIIFLQDFFKRFKK